MTAGKPHAIPPGFFATLTEAERMELFATWRLTGALCERLWRMSEFQGPPPDSIELMVSRRELVRHIRETMVAKGWSDLKINRQLRKAAKAIR
jgi:hypothetical protein